VPLRAIAWRRISSCAILNRLVSYNGASAARLAPNAWTSAPSCDADFSRNLGRASMGFIPSGYLTLGTVIDRIVEHDDGPIFANMRSHIPEFVTLTRRDIRARTPTGDKRSRKRLGKLREERSLAARAHNNAIDNAWQALGDGALPSKVLSDQGFLFPLQVEFWRSASARNAVITERVSWWLFDANPPMQLNGRPLVERSAFERWLAGTATSASEHRLSQWLERRMRAAPTEPVPKSDMKTKAQSEGYAFSQEGFDRAWGRAVGAANAPKWSSRGRRRTQQLADNPGPERR
jgi:hypothetical protein